MGWGHLGVESGDRLGGGGPRVEPGQGLCTAGGGTGPPPKPTAGWQVAVRGQEALQSGAGQQWHEGNQQGQKGPQHSVIIIHGLHCLGQDGVLLLQCLYLLTLQGQELCPELTVLLVMLLLVLVPCVLTGNVLCLPVMMVCGSEWCPQMVQHGMQVGGADAADRWR